MQLYEKDMMTADDTKYLGGHNENHYFYTKTVKKKKNKYVNEN